MMASRLLPMRVLAVAALATVLPGARPAPADVRLTPATAAEFYTYSLPLLEVARRRDAHVARYGANIFQHNRNLADDKFREVTTPNNDTVYSIAFVDLGRGSARLSIPATGSRYFSMAIMDAWSNNFAYLGTRATGGRAVTVTVVAPGAPAPAGAVRIIRSPTRWVWMLGRTLVTGPGDLAAAARVQDAIRLSAPPVQAFPAATPPQDADAETLRRAALALMAQTPPPSADAPVLARFRAAGLLAPRITPAAAAVLQAGFDQAKAASRQARRPGEVINGWIYPKPNLGNFGTDYPYRAAVAITGLAAMGPDEAMYLRSAPAASGQFDGARAYQLHFAAGALPPVDAFWSLSMYERTADGGYYFVANPLGRYAFGDRTPGARKNADGSLDIWISHADPGPERRANWLPAPAGPFALSLRAYLPRPELRDGRWRAPAVDPLN